jgi:hypothetical protein
MPWHRDKTEDGRESTSTYSLCHGFFIVYEINIFQRIKYEDNTNEGNTAEVFGMCGQT